MLNLFNKHILSFLLLLLSQLSIAQNKDTNIVLETLKKEDLIEFQKQKDKTKFSLNRTGENSKDIIQNHYIISKYEIFQYDCITLVDVLKVIPGFRISQPGNAQLGELFSIDGLIGNINMTVMINGIPINPGGLPGIPIGAQLPIKQAERIEVIIGPSILYGSSSMAGIVNIVIVEVERPVEVNSSINIGDNGLRNINTLMSGKVGKANNLVMYSLYGSSTNGSITQKDLDTTQFHVSKKVVNNVNYRGTSANKNVPDFEGLPWSSTLIGANIRFRGITVTGALMTRKTHSAMGASPDKISYSDKSTFVGERSSVIGIDYQYPISNAFAIGIKGSYLFYEMDENSTYLGIDHTFSNGRNFLYAKSTSINIEPTILFTQKKLSVIVGGQATPENITNNQNFLQQPYNATFYTTDNEGNYIIENSIDSTSSISPYAKGNENLVLTTSAFTQAKYQIGRITALFGLQYHKTQDSKGLFNYNLGIGYQLFEKFNIRGTYTHMSQLPNIYFNNNNYTGNYDPLSYNNVNYTQIFVKLSPEIIDRIDLSFNYYLDDKTRFTARIYRQVLSNGLAQKIIVATEPSDVPISEYFMGYTNNVGKSSLNVLQLTAYHRGERSNATLDMFIRSGKEHIDNIGTIKSYRNTPGFSLYGTISANYNNSRNESALILRYESRFIDHVNLKNGELNAPRTIRSINLDWSHNIAFGKNLYLKLKILNLFKTRNYGIYYNWLNSNTLNYVPQIERIFSFGIKYRLN